MTLTMRIKCAKCDNMILKETSIRNDGICEPCAKAKRQEIAHNQFVERMGDRLQFIYNDGYTHPYICYNVSVLDDHMEARLGPRFHEGQKVSVNIDVQKFTDIIHALEPLEERYAISATCQPSYFATFISSTTKLRIDREFYGSSKAVLAHYPSLRKTIEPLLRAADKIRNELYMEIKSGRLDY